jgi:hypothetical protein
MRRWVVCVGVLAVAFAAGCGESGPKRYRVSGTVTFNGQSVPSGEIVFTPDTAQQNSGPQGTAQIKDGKYDTGAAGGIGVVGGPMVIEVTGIKNGQLICEHTLKADLPREDATKDIDIPKSAAVKPGRSNEPPP